MGLRKRVADERGYLAEDATKVVRTIRRKTPHVLTGARKSSFGLFVGATAIVVGLAQWAAPAAWVFAGIALIVYGLVIVDVDEVGPRRRRRPRG